LSKPTNQVLKWANHELYRQLGDIPLPSLCLVEGGNDTGKSVLLQQLSWDALCNGLKVSYITTEGATKVLLNQFNSLSFTVSSYFINGKLKIIELHTKKLKWNRGVAYYLLELIVYYISKAHMDLFVIDSLTPIIAESEEKDVLNFLTRLRNITGTLSKSIFFSLHPFIVSKELLTRIRAIVDGHIILKIVDYKGKIVRTINISKMRGATKTQEKIIAFEVVPAQGIKPLPFSSAKA